MSNLDETKRRALRIGKGTGGLAFNRVSIVEPGDATRYELLLVQDERSGKRLFGWVNGPENGRVMWLPDYVPSADYIAQKLGAKRVRAEWEGEIFQAWLTGVLS